MRNFSAGVAMSISLAGLMATASSAQDINRSNDRFFCVVDGTDGALTYQFDRRMPCSLSHGFVGDGKTIACYHTNRKKITGPDDDVQNIHMATLCEESNGLFMCYGSFTGAYTISMTIGMDGRFVLSITGYNSYSKKLIHKEEEGRCVSS